MSDDFSLRTVPSQGSDAPATPGGPTPAGAPGVNETAELLADLLAATGLIPDDKLALAKGRAGASGALAQALVDEGIATSEGIARTLAARHPLPLIDLAAVTVDPAATGLVPLHVLERVGALPYAVEGDVLKVAIADPGNVHGIDELRIATRLTVELEGRVREVVETEW